MVHTTRNWKASHGLLARRFSRHFVQRFPPSSCLYKLEWDTWLRRMYVTAIILVFSLPVLEFAHTASSKTKRKQETNCWRMRIGRWLFIIDGIITLPLALAGYIFFPNLPQSGKKTWWTTEEEHLLSIKRMQNIGRAGKQPWTKAKAKGILLSWHTYLLRESYFIPFLSLNNTDNVPQHCYTFSGTMAFPNLLWDTGWKVLMPILLLSPEQLTLSHRSITVSSTSGSKFQWS